MFIALWNLVKSSLSDKTLTMLARHIHHELLPTLDEDDEGFVTLASALPLTTVEEEIKSIATRNNYGVEVPSSVKLPAALCVWRWEVRAQYMDWLPKNCREKAEARLAERIQVRGSDNLSCTAHRPTQTREHIKVLLEAMPEEERNNILGPKKTVNKLPTKQMNRLETTSSSEIKAEEGTPESSKKQGKKNEYAENDEVFISFTYPKFFVDSSRQGDASIGLVHPKKVQDPEKNTKVLRILTNIYECSLIIW